jgi:hypothetical protein
MSRVVATGRRPVEDPGSLPVAETPGQTDKVVEQVD